MFATEKHRDVLAAPIGITKEELTERLLEAGRRHADVERAILLAEKLGTSIKIGERRFELSDSAHEDLSRASF